MARGFKSVLGSSAGVQGAFDAAEEFVREQSGANGDAVRAAGRALAKHMRRKLSVKASVTRRSFNGESTRTERSNPGEPPRLVTGRTRRSIGQAVVDGVRRVGAASFVARLQNEGVDTTVQVTPTGREFGKRRRKGGKSRRTLKIAPRPFMDAALAAAQGEMENVTVGELQKNVR